jgi:predicted transcriptional regulator
MKQILIELDDRCARDLERVAPARNRKRAEFVRLAIRSAIDRTLDRATGEAYRSRSLPGEVLASDLVGWDEKNGLARTPDKARGRRRSAKSAA